MYNHLKVLILEDSKSDADLIQYELKKGGFQFTSLIVDNKVRFTQALENFKPNIILSDHSMPQFSSAQALKIYADHFREQQQAPPFILVAGTVSEEFAVQCIKEGAHDYVLKDRLQRLPIAIHNALEKCRIEAEHRKINAEKLLLLERYEHLAESTSEAIWDWDIINNNLFCGKGFEKIFGHKDNSGTQKNHLNTTYISAEDIKRVMLSVEDAIASRANKWSNEYQYLKGNGQYAFVQDTALIIRNEQGVAVRMIGVIKDITNKKKEELRLKLLESVITNTTDAVLIAETDAVNPTSLSIIYVNEAFTKMTGYSAEDILGSSPDILQGKNANSAALERLHASLAKNESCQLEMISCKKTGEEFWKHFSGSPIADSNGVFTHWVFIERDITEQVNHIKAIEDQNVRLKEIAWLQSHVVRAPLARMMGFINLIKSNKDITLSTKDFLPYVLEAAIELDTIIRKIVNKSEEINSPNQ